MRLQQSIKPNIKAGYITFVRKVASQNLAHPLLKFCSFKNWFNSGMPMGFWWIIKRYVRGEIIE